MKKFFKRFASSMAAVMVVTLMVPTMPVSAATSITKEEINEANYLGKTSTLNGNYNLTSTMNAGVSASKTVITSKSDSVNAKKSSNGKSSSSKSKRSAKTVAINNPVTEVGVGKSVYDFNTTVTTASGKKTTDKIYFFIDQNTNTAGATVSSKGVISTQKTGSFTIVVKTAKNKKYKKAGKFTAVSQAITVNVPLKISSIKLNKLNTFTVTFNSVIDSTVTKDDIIISNASTFSREYVKGVTLSNDRTSIIVEVYSSLSTGQSYNVSIKVGTSTLTSTITSSKGTVTRISAADQVVKAGTPSTIAYTVYDESGLDITSDTYVTFESTIPLVNNKITLSSGQMAYVTVVYTNISTGTQIRSNRIKVTGSSSAITSIDNYTIANTGSKPSFTSPVTTIALNTTGKSLYVQIRDQYKEQYTAVNGTNVTFEALDPNIVIVDSHTGGIIPVATGTGYVKIVSGTISKVVPITVIAPSHVATIQVPTVITGSLTGGINNPSAYISVVDQYGTPINGQTITLTRYSGNSVSNTKLVGVTSNGGYTFTFTPASAGTTVFQVSSGNLEPKYISVTITPSDMVETSYAIIGLKDLDIARRYDNSLSSSYVTEVSLYTLNASGYKVKNVTPQATFKVTNPSGNVSVVTGNSIKLDTAGSIIAETTGKYTVIAYINNVEVARNTFNVTDSAVAPKVTLSSNRITNGVVSKASIADCLALPMGYTLSDVKFISSNSSEVPSRDTFDGRAFSTSHVTATLYNVSVKITNGTRSYIISNVGNIIVTE